MSEAGQVGIRQIQLRVALRTVGHRSCGSQRPTGVSFLAIEPQTCTRCSAVLHGHMLRVLPSVLPHGTIFSAESCRAHRTFLA